MSAGRHRRPTGMSRIMIEAGGRERQEGVASCSGLQITAGCALRSLGACRCDAKQCRATLYSLCTTIHNGSYGLNRLWPLVRACQVAVRWGTSGISRRDSASERKQPTRRSPTARPRTQGTCSVAGQWWVTSGAVRDPARDGMETRITFDK